MVDAVVVHNVPTKDELESRTQAQLMEFAEEISALMEDAALPEMHETDPTLEALFQQRFKLATVEVETNAQRLRIDGLVAVWTRDGRLVLRRTGAEKYIEVAARPGNIVTYDGKQYEIRDVEVRYLRDTPEFYSCGVRMINAEV